MGISNAARGSSDTFCQFSNCRCLREVWVFLVEFSKKFANRFPPRFCWPFHQPFILKVSNQIFGRPRWIGAAESIVGRRVCLMVVVLDQRFHLNPKPICWFEPPYEFTKGGQ